jgi:hypothetical protein
MQNDDRKAYDAVAHAAALQSTVLVIWIVILARTPYQHYAMLPPELFEGFGVGRLLLSAGAFRGFLLRHSTLIAFKWMAVTLSLWALIWKEHRPLLIPLAAAVILVLDQITKALGGFVNHAQTLALFVLLLLALVRHPVHKTATSPLQRRNTQPAHAQADNAQEAARRRCEGIIWLGQLMVVMAYTFVGVNRLIEGGVAIFAGDALPRYVDVTSHYYSAYGFTVGAAVLKSAPLVVTLKVGFAIVTLFEATSPFVFRFTSFRFCWLFVMTGFHLSSLVIMNIFFWENLLLIWVLFGWRGSSEELRRRQEALWSRSLLKNPSV